MSENPEMNAEEKRYPLKWALSYQGKLYAEVYGKKKAYEKLYRLSLSVSGLTVEPVATRSLPRNASTRNKNDYYKEWRARNRDKIRAYQRDYHRRKREENRRSLSED